MTEFIFLGYIEMKNDVNVRRLCDGVAIANRKLNFAVMLNRNTEVEPMTVSRTIAK